MPLYESLQAARFQLGSIDTSSFQGSPGQRILQALAQSREPMPFLEDRIAVAMDLFHQEMQRLWTWRPSGASAAGGGLLDGAAKTGECAQLVSGFKALLLSPAPYGLALNEDNVSSIEWPQGGDVVLFVVKHERAYFGLHANVLKPDWQQRIGADRFQGLYAWGNHKVLRVNCNGRVRFFDPCYNNVYLLADEMADYRLSQTDVAGKIPVVVRYRGRARMGGAVTFDAVGSATPEILKQNVRTMNNDYPVLIGPTG